MRHLACSGSSRQPLTSSPYQIITIITETPLTIPADPGPTDQERSGARPTAVANPQVSTLPSIKESLDPKMDLTQELIVVEIVQDAYLIRVALESKDPAEAAMIVNAVVESYKVQAEHIRSERQQEIAGKPGR